MNSITLTQQDIINFWGKVSIKGPNECWNWNAGKDRSGYGAFAIKRKIFTASRVAWVIENGEIPDGTLVLHKCDNRACCNPNHLFLGTNQDNMIDMVRKGRNPDKRGEKCPTAKLKMKDVSMIRGYLKSGVSCLKIGKMFGVCEMTVSNIKLGKTWK